MARPIVLADTSVLITHFRSTNKDRTALTRLAIAGYGFCISNVTEFELLVGVNAEQLAYWDELLDKIPVLPFGSKSARTAMDIDRILKKRNKRIGIPDLFIAATAVSQGIPRATLNKEHFERVPGVVFHDLDRA